MVFVSLGTQKLIKYLIGIRKNAKKVFWGLQQFTVKAEMTVATKVGGQSSKK
jgi:hypothetical protein